MGRKRNPPLPLLRAKEGHEVPRQDAGWHSVMGCSPHTVNQSRVWVHGSGKQREPRLSSCGMG